jgi:short subunit fatty acids transporter
LIGPEAAQTLQENEAFLHLSPEALDVQAAGNLAEHFAWGAGFVAGKLFERGVAGEVESSVRQSRAVEATRYSASYASGWTAGVAETQAWHARATK